MPNISCMNCEYFYAKTSEYNFCTIDNEIVKEPLEQLKFCRAFIMWWGAVE